MDRIPMLLTSAHTLAKNRETEAALGLYNDAFNLLIEEAADFARVQTGSISDEDHLRALTPILLSYSTQYLTQNLTAATILNAMGSLFAELGDYENAKQKFTEAIHHIPVDVAYEEPKKNLDDISSRVINTAQLEQIDE